MVSPLRQLSDFELHLSAELSVMAEKVLYRVIQKDRHNSDVYIS